MGFAKLGLIVVALMISSCAKDRTTDDAKREKWLEDQARVRAAKGKYRGFMMSDLTHAPVGAFQIELNPRTDVSPGTDGTPDNPKSILEVTLTLDIPREMTIATTKAYFDPESGLVQANIVDETQTDPSAPKSGPPKVLASLTMSLGSGRLSGTMHFTGLSSDYDQTFDLLRDGKSMAQLVQEGGITEPPTSSGAVIALVGASKFLSVGATKPVHVVATFPQPGSQHEFLNFLNPVKALNLTFTYDGPVVIENQNSLWDTRTGLLNGETKNGANPVLKFTCRATIHDSLNQLFCDHWNTAVGKVATTDAHLPTDKDKPVTDTSGTNEMKMRTFYGRASTGDPVGGRRISMIVVYPARDSVTDIDNLFYPPASIHLQMTVDLRSPVISFDDKETQWDKGTGQVHAKSSGVGSPTVPDLHRQLECTGFQFTEQRSPFDCTLIIDRAAPIPMRFDSWR